MEYRVLGNTGLKVSAIGIGTVSLGVDYGIEAPGGFGAPGEKDAIDLLKGCACEGINVFDTAPAYGRAEELLGKAFGNAADVVVMTKVSIPRVGEARLRGRALNEAVTRSIDGSLKRLKRERIEVVQVHNATTDVIDEEEMLSAIESEIEKGKLLFAGASVYTVEEAYRAAAAFDTVQAAYSMLDQRMSEVFLKNERAGIIVRSAFLKGALTEKSRWLPPELSALGRAAEGIREALGVSWDEMPEAALRFCLSNERVSVVLAGVRTAEELKSALKACRRGKFDGNTLGMLNGMALKDEKLLNPVNWPIR
ncbi:MAG: hypothetical protein A2054_09255 [Deltaproteobacteria bacterium GWA2_55_10]|nr:MAG: hypothetical protein A2054_09255 [Deltaproteobacteria bacterium GWA2_55_10]